MSDEMDELSDVLTEHLAVKDEAGHVVLQVALIATVYFAEAHRCEVREAIVSCCEGYFRRWGEHLRWALHPDTRRMERFGKGKGSNPRTWLPAMDEDESFSLTYHGAEYERGASAFSLEAMGMERVDAPAARRLDWDRGHGTADGLGPWTVAQPREGGGWRMRVTLPGSSTY